MEVCITLARINKKEEQVDTKTNDFISVIGFEASYHTLVHWLTNRRSTWRQENQTDVCEVLNFRVSRAIGNQMGNLSVLSSKR